MITILELTHERETYIYLASGLTQPHQQKVKIDLLRKADNIQEQINELNRHDINYETS
jgi:hypothetical protein